MEIREADKHDHGVIMMKSTYHEELFAAPLFDR